MHVTTQLDIEEVWCHLMEELHVVEDCAREEAKEQDNVVANVGMMDPMVKLGDKVGFEPPPPKGFGVIRSHEILWDHQHLGVYCGGCEPNID